MEREREFNGQPLTRTGLAWPDDLQPSRSAALARMARVQPEAYARTRNHIDGAVTGLSPYLTHGVVTLRAPPADLPGAVVVIGVYLQDYHQARPWSEARWRWVDAAMAAVAPQRWFTDAAGLAHALAGAALVRSVDDPHLRRWLAPLARLDAAPLLFPVVDRRCDSFSQWWTRTTQGIKSAGGIVIKPPENQAGQQLGASERFPCERQLPCQACG